MLRPDIKRKTMSSPSRPAESPKKTDKRRRPVAPDPRDEGSYCWQHREQANISAQSSPGPRPTATPILEGRTSLDTLTDRLGLVDLNEKKHGNGRLNSSKPQSKKSSLLCCFCFSVPEEDEELERPQPHPVQHTSNQGLAPQAVSGGRSSRKSRKSTSSRTATIKDFIPDTLDTTTASALMTEMSRPFGSGEEPGFIYMFWLTPMTQSKSAAPVDAARSLLAPPSPNNQSRSRSASNAVRNYAASDPNSSKNTMLLKIGRAANVQRRLNEWQRQCGREVELLRYYPYIPGSQESSGVVPHMTQHVHRVERLVHLELSGMGFKADAGKCAACGREHREWFEVQATRDGIKAVDDIIRRWIEWDETNS
ncbi:hypothetical protein NXS19_002579 [Fusarium pseudograminearum]|nr:hypothetical protein NXS19_002579 [Fusarium pseudograminearum]